MILLVVLAHYINAYSSRWFETFHVGISDERTSREVEFISAFAPAATFPRVLDVCCGMGRHSRVLSTHGYAVTGVDRDALILDKARALAGGPRYICADIRDYQPEPAAYDAITVMGQSFGHFDLENNRRALEQLAQGLRRSGRLILDLWNPDFFQSHQGEREFDLPAGLVHERKYVREGRLLVELSYPGGEQEEFEWQLFTRDEMTALARSCSLSLIACCTDFDRSGEPSADHARIQFVLER